MRLDVPPAMAGLSFSGPAAGKRGYLFGNEDPARGRGNAALNVSFSDFDPGDLVVMPVTMLLSSAHYSCAELGAPNVSASLLIDPAPACWPPAVQLSAVYETSSCKVTISQVDGAANATYPELSALMPCIIFAFGETSTLTSDEAFNITITASDVVANHNSGPAFLNYGSITVALNFTVTLSSAAHSAAAASALFVPAKPPLDPWPGGDAENDGNFRESVGTLVFAPLGMSTRASARGGGAAVQQARISLQSPACGRADALLLSGAAVAGFVADGERLNSTTPRAVVASCVALSADALENSALLGHLTDGALVCGCGGGYIFANGTAAPAEYAFLLGATQLFVGPRNDLPLASPREVVFAASSQWQPAATAASAYMEDYFIAHLPVQPANDPLRAPAGAAASGGVVLANLQELGGPPVVQLTVAQNCSDARLAGFGFPANAAACFEDDDPVAAVRGIALAPAAAVQLSFYDFTTASGSASINGNASASADFALSPAGAPSLDCAGVPCWRRNYSLGGLASLPPWGLRFSAGTTQLNYSLVVNDTFADDPVNASLAVSGLTLAVAVVPAAGSSGASAPNISAVVGPPGAGAGLSVLGGDAIDIFGSGLGFVGANVTGWLVGGRWPNDDVVWRLSACAVVVDMTHVRCAAPEGFGRGFSVVLQVYGVSSAPSVATAASAAAALLSYETPRVLALAPFNAANLLRQASPSASASPTVPPSISVTSMTSLNASVAPSLSLLATLSPTVSVSPVSPSPTPSPASPTSTRSNNSSPLSTPSSAASASASGSASSSASGLPSPSGSGSPSASRSTSGSALSSASSLPSLSSSGSRSALQSASGSALSSASSLPSVSGSSSPSASQSATNTTAHGRLLRELGGWVPGAPRALQVNSTDNSTSGNATVAPLPSASPSNTSSSNATASPAAVMSASATASASKSATATATLLAHGSASPTNTPISNVSLLQLLPAGGSDLLALANPASGGLVGIQVTASGLPRRWLIPDAGFTVSLVAGASEILVPSCNRTDDFTLQCLVPPGASADLEVRIAYRGGSSRAPLVSFAAPALDSVAVDNATGYRLVLLGRNLGSNASLISGNLSLERVELLADPHFDDTTLAPGQRAARCAYAPCGPAPALALACAYVEAQTHVECALDPAGFGERLSVRIWVAGQSSGWSTQTVSYPAPSISSIALVNQSTAVPGSQSTRAGSRVACDGTSFVRITGAGFIEGDVDTVQLVIGGTNISNANLVFVGSNTPASAIAARTVASAAISSVEARVPPGYGLVTVALRVGSRTAFSQLEYETPTITREVKGLGGVINYDVIPRSITLSGTGFSACAFCSDSRSASSWGAVAVTLCAGVLFNVPDIGCARPPLYSFGPVAVLTLNATTKLGDGLAASAFVSDQTTDGALAALSVLAWSADGTSVTLQITDMPSPPWALVAGTLTLGFVGASTGAVWAPSAAVAALGYNFQRDLATLPYGVAMFPTTSPWSATTPVTLKLNYAGGNAGSVRIAQYPLPAPTIFENAPFVFECPTVWNTTVTTRPAVGTFGLATVTVPAFASTFSAKSASVNVSGLTVSPGCASNCSTVSFALGTLSLSGPNGSSSLLCLSCVISEFRLERRFAWSKTDLLWQRRAADASCYVISWAGYDGVVNQITNGLEDSIVFVPPPWQGTNVFLKVVADGNEQGADGSPLSGPFSYSSPAIAAVVPNVGPTNRSVVSIRGAFFGPFASVRAAFNLSSLSGCVYNDAPWPSAAWKSDGDSDGANLAFFRYNSASGDRSCAVLSWAADAVACLAPVGVPSSLNDVVVLAVDPLWALDHSAASRYLPASLSGLSAAYQYNSARVTSLGRTDGGELLTAGGYELQLLGTDLSAFPVAGDGLNESFANSGDLASKLTWTPSISLVEVAGRGLVPKGLVASNFIFTAHGHGRVAFLLPNSSVLSGAFCIFEGTISVVLSFSSLYSPNAPVTVVAQLVAAPPHIDFVEVVSDPADASFAFNNDPCLALNTTTFLAFAPSATMAPVALPSPSETLTSSASIAQTATASLASSASASARPSLLASTSASAASSATAAASPSATASPSASASRTTSSSASGTQSASPVMNATARRRLLREPFPLSDRKLQGPNATSGTANGTASASASASAPRSATASATGSATPTQTPTDVSSPTPFAATNASNTTTLAGCPSDMALVASGSRIDGCTAVPFDQCVADVRSGGVAATRAIYPKTAPCFRATGQPKLRIIGRNFGSGKTTSNELSASSAGFVQFVKVRPVGASGENASVLCAVSPSNLKDSVVKSDQLIECVLVANLPRGPVAIDMMQAFRPRSAADFGIVPYAACPCGAFTKLDGQRCEACPTGALCAGADVAAVAKRNYWQTNPEWNPTEWLDSRDIDLVQLANQSLIASPFKVVRQKILYADPNPKADSSLVDYGYHFDLLVNSTLLVPPFVRCVDLGTCMTNNTCAAFGPTDRVPWMCVSCPPGPPHSQKSCTGPNKNQCVCEQCTELQMAETAGIISAGLVGLVILVVLAASQALIAHEVAGLLQCAARCACFRGCRRYNALETEPPGENTLRDERSRKAARDRAQRAAAAAAASRNVTLDEKVERLSAELQHIARLVTAALWYRCSSCSAEWPAERLALSTSPEEASADATDYSTCPACMGVGRAPPMSVGTLRPIEDFRAILARGSEHATSAVRGLESAVTELAESPQEASKALALKALYELRDDAMHRIDLAASAAAAAAEEEADASASSIARSRARARAQLAAAVALATPGAGPSPTPTVASAGAKAAAAAAAAAAASTAAADFNRFLQWLSVNHEGSTGGGGGVAREPSAFWRLLSKATEGRTFERMHIGARAPVEERRKPAPKRSLAQRIFACCYTTRETPPPISSAHKEAADATARRREVWDEMHRQLPLADLLPTSHVLLHLAVLRGEPAVEAPMPATCLLCCRRRMAPAERKRIKHLAARTLRSELAQRGVFPGLDAPRKELVSARLAARKAVLDPIHAMETFVLEAELNELNVKYDKVKGDDPGGLCAWLRDVALSGLRAVGCAAPRAAASKEQREYRKKLLCLLQIEALESALRASKTLLELFQLPVPRLEQMLPGGPDERLFALAEPQDLVAALVSPTPLPPPSSSARASRLASSASY